MYILCAVSVNTVTYILLLIQQQGSSKQTNLIFLFTLQSILVQHYFFNGDGVFSPANKHVCLLSLQ